MKMITRDTDYAITALLELAREQGRSMSAVELSERLDISHSFLRRILQVLAGKGIIDSRRGLGGGFTLAREPQKITVREVVELFQGSIHVGGCHEKCGRTARCVLRRKLLSLEARLVADLMDITIGSLAEEQVSAR